MMKRKKHVMESLGDQGQAPDLRSSHFLWGEARQRGQMGGPQPFQETSQPSAGATGAREASGGAVAE